MFEGSAASRRGLLPAAAGRRRAAQRIDQRRSHELLGSRADQRARARAVDGIGSHGLPAAGADRGEVREPARRRAERAAAELREPSVRPRADGDAWRRCFRRTIRITGRRSARSTICRRHARRSARVLPRYYHPANASLAIAGDIDPDERARARGALLRRHSSRDRRSRRSCATHALAGATSGCCSRIASSCRACIWPGIRRRCSRPATPSSISRADLLANGKTSRLYRAPGVRRAHRDRRRGVAELARDRRLLPGRPRPPRPGTRWRSSRRRSSRRSRALAADGPTSDEMERGRVQAEAQFVFRLQTVGGFGGKSDQLNAYNVVPRTTRLTSTSDLARYQDATAESLAARSRTYLCGQPPRHAEHRAARPDRAGCARFDGRAVVSVSQPGRSLAAARSLGPAPLVPFPASRKSALPNGLRVWTVQHRAVPVVTFMLLRAARRRRPIRPARKGSRRSPPTCSTRAAAIDRRSRCTRRSRASARSSTPTSARTRRCSTLTTLSRFAAARAAAARRPACAARASTPTTSSACASCGCIRLTQLRDMPRRVADRAFAQLLYGAHPYGHLADRQRGRRCGDRRSTTCARFTPRAIGRRPRR